MNQTKICSKCNIEKSIIEFYNKASGKFGVAAICKICEKKYKHDNKKSKAEYDNLYRQNNKELIASKYKQKYLINKTKINAKSKQYYESNKEKVAATQKQYRQTPKGKATDKANRQNRRVAKLNNGGKHTGKQILALFDLQSGKCPYCESKLYKSGNGKYHIDHVIPLSKSGSNDISNIQLLCPKCNMSKKDKLPEEFAANFNKLF